MKSRISTMAAGLAVVLVVQAGATWAAPDASGATEGAAGSGKVRIDLHGTQHGPQFHAFAEGQFTISGAISDRGTFRLDFEGGRRPGYLLTLSGAKGAIRVAGDGVDYHRERHWRVMGGTRAYSGLRGRGGVHGFYYARGFDLAMIGTVSAPA